MAATEAPKGPDLSDFLDLESFVVLGEMELQTQTSKYARDSISKVHSTVKLQITSAASDDDNNDPDAKPDNDPDDEKEDIFDG